MGALKRAADEWWEGVTKDFVGAILLKDAVSQLLALHAPPSSLPAVSTHRLLRATPADQLPDLIADFFESAAADERLLGGDGNDPACGLMHRRG